MYMCMYECNYVHIYVCLTHERKLPESVIVSYETCREGVFMSCENFIGPLCSSELARGLGLNRGGGNGTYFGIGTLLCTVS